MTPEEFNATLLDPIYDALGVPLRIILKSGQAVDVTALDKTEGVTIGDPGQFVLDTVRPAFVVRRAELVEKGTDAAVMADGQAVSGFGTDDEKTWRISAPREVRGEVYLVLHEER